MYASRNIIPQTTFQEEVGITEVEVHEQQTDDILLIDPNNRQYEIFPTI